MVEATDSRHGYDFAVRVCVRRRHPTGRRSLLQRKVRAVLMVIANVGGHQPFQMPFVEHDDIIKQIPSAIPNPAFCNTVLPRTAEARPLGLDAEALHRADNFLVEVRRAIEDQVGGDLVIRKGLAQLLRDPRTTWVVPSDVEMKNTTPLMRDHKEAVEHAKRKRRHGEEIHRRNRFTVVVLECRPSLCGLRIAGRSTHPTQNSSLREVEPKHRKLAMNARCSPRSVAGHHAEDEVSQFPARLMHLLPA